MIINNMKFDFDDLLIQPSAQSNITSRKNVNVFDEKGMLPLFTAPMDTVIDMNNFNIYENNKIHSIIPRTNKDYVLSSNQWKAVGLDEFKSIFIDNIHDFDKRYILIDIANAHMKKLFELVEKSKLIYGDKLVLMVGNVANPDTYKLLSDAGADFIRLGIGGGSGCLTSKNVGIGYPMGSLISDSYDISCTLKTPAKIVADGGMKNYSDIIKALALGSDYVMIGGIFNKSLESAGHTYAANKKFDGYTVPGDKVDQYSHEVRTAFQNGALFYKKFRGMSTKEVQLHLGNELRSSEGVTRMVQVEYTLEGWIENFTDYLSSAMSYTGSSNLNEFIGKVNLNVISKNAYDRFNK